MSLIKSFFGKDKNVEDQTQTQPENGQETQENIGENQNENQTQEQTQPNEPLRVFVAKEAVLDEVTKEVVAYKYKDTKGEVTEVAAGSELLEQFDKQIEAHPEQSPSESKEDSSQAEGEKPQEVAYAKPEYQVLDVGGIVVRSYNAGEHEGAENAKECAEKFAAKVNGTVKEITE